jgi:hypothetical protein
LVAVFIERQLTTEARGGGKRTLPMDLIFRIIELPHLDSAFIEIIEQTCIDAHFAEILTERLPVCATTADWTVMYANHSITPDIGLCFA